MSRLFAGTEFDRPALCERCGKAPADCRCTKLPEKKKMAERPGGKHYHPNQLDSGLVLNATNAVAPESQVAKIRTEKRKGNRLVTVVTGLEHPGNDLPALCAELKQTLGVGGSVQGRTIELQGEHAEKIQQHLEVERGLNARVV